MSPNEKVIIVVLGVITFGSIMALTTLVHKKYFAANAPDELNEETIKAKRQKNLLVLLSIVPIILGAVAARVYGEFWFPLAFSVIGGTVVCVLLAHKLKKVNSGVEDKGKLLVVVSSITMAYRFVLIYILLVFLFYGFDFKKVFSLI